jgi:iron complex outermembrane receptor protein
MKPQTALTSIVLSMGIGHLQAQTPSSPQHQPAGTISSQGSSSQEQATETSPPHASAKPKDPERMTVRGERTDSEASPGILGLRSLESTPFSISTYDADLIARQQYVTANQVLRRDPALTNVATAGGFSAFNLSFRGFPSGADAISFYGMGPGAMFSGSLGQLYSVERLEVTKGPSAGLAGFSPQASVGGAVNVVPKLARTQNLRRFATGFRERSILSAHGDVNQVLSSSTAIRLNLASEAGETFYGGRDERDIAALSLRYDRSDSLRLIVGYDQIRVRSEGYQNAFVLAPGVPVPRAPDPNQNLFQKWTYLNQEWSYGYGSVEWDVSPDWSLLIQGVYGIRRRPLLSSGTALIQNEAGDTLLRPNYFAEGTRYKPFYGANLFLRGRAETLGLNHRLTLAYLGQGFVFKTAQGRSLATIPSNLYQPVYVERPALSTLAAGTNTDLKAHTQALSDDIALSKHTNLLIGVKNSTLLTEGFDVPTARRIQHRQDTATTPFAALSHEWTPGSSAYVSYVEGLERGGVAPASANNADRPMPPLRNHQVELGIKSRWQDSFFVTAAVFQTDRALEYLDAESNAYVQAGLQRNRGLELSWDAQFANTWTVTGGVLWIDPRIVRDGQVENRRAPGVPSFHLPLTVQWRLSQLLELSASLQHFSKQYVDIENERILSPWTRIDAGLRAETDFWQRPTVLQVSVENVAAQRYWASAAAGQLTLGAPQIWKLGIQTDL